MTEKAFRPEQARIVADAFGKHGVEYLFIGKGGAPCGEVNAKDAFGAYLGYQRYISVARELTMLAQDMPHDEFEESWREMCK